MTKKSFRINRREALAAVGGLGALGIGGSLIPGGKLLSQNASGDKKYIFIICGAGGANIVDAFLAQSTGPAAYDNLVTMQDTPFSAVPALKNSIKGAINLGNGYAQQTFLQKHKNDMAVMTCEVSSVNHIVAAKRAMSGDNANGGRTLPEAIAMEFGKGLPLANLMLSGGGYANRGDDGSVPEIFRAQAVQDPLMFAFATNGFKGVSPLAGVEEMRLARELRGQLEVSSRFHTRFKSAKMLDTYLLNRDRIVDALEKGDTITKLMLLDPEANQLSKFGFEVSKDVDLVRTKFPDMGKDIYEARLALAFLAAKNGLTNAVTIAPSPTPLISAAGTPNAPIVFDWSHVDHRGAQNSMWSYILKGADALIDLLKATDIDGDPAKGKMWDKSLIYFATEFGRDKVKESGSGHHLNNGVVLVSPMLNGNKIYGGVDPMTALTYGFDPKTGQPDKAKNMKEHDIYGAIAHAMGLEYSNRGDYSSMVKKKA